MALTLTVEGVITDEGPSLSISHRELNNGGHESIFQNTTSGRLRLVQWIESVEAGEGFPGRDFTTADKESLRVAIDIFTGAG